MDFSLFNKLGTKRSFSDHLVHISYTIYPTKMCIKSASYLHLKSANWPFDMMLFLVLMLLIKFSKIAHLKGAFHL